MIPNPVKGKYMYHFLYLFDKVKCKMSINAFVHNKIIIIIIIIIGIIF